MTFKQNEINSIIKSLEGLQQFDNLDIPKISVIVPVFNTEKYLSKCLLSILKQTEKQIEIIIVNDGSTDDSEKIISIFAKYDKRIVVINQEHKLQGAARNNGIKHAKGEYISFIDSDDWIDLDYFEKLYTAAEKYNSDIALATNVRTGNGRTKKRLNIVKEEFLSDIQKKVDICRQWREGCPTNKIYRKDFLIKNNILFPEGVYCEDKIFTVKTVFYSNGIATVPDVYYYYFRNPKSTVNKKIKAKKYKNDKNSARLEVLKFLRENNAQIRDKDFWAITKQIDFLGFPIYTKKESLHTARHYIFSVIKIKEEVF